MFNELDFNRLSSKLLRDVLAGKDFPFFIVFNELASASSLLLVLESAKHGDDTLIDNMTD